MDDDDDALEMPDAWQAAVIYVEEYRKADAWLRNWSMKFAGS